jgi:hypothetical protein
MTADRHFIHMSICSPLRHVRLVALDRVEVAARIALSTEASRCTR